MFALFSKNSIVLTEIEPEHKAEYNAWLANGELYSGEYSTCKIADIPEHAFDLLKQQLKFKLAAIRYEKETSGVEIDGVSVRTDRESQSQIAGAALGAIIDPKKITQFKGTNGWVSLDATGVKNISLAVNNFVSEMFATENAHSAAIDAISDPMLLVEYDISAGWPK